MAYIGSSPTKVVSRQSANIFTYTATANQTAFTGADDNGNTLACSPSDIMVHMNGIKLEESDYSASTTTVTLVSGAAAGDEVTITAFLTFESADHYTKSAADTRYVNASGDTMSGDLTIQDPSNTPTLKLSAASASNFLSINRDSSTGHYHIESDETGSSIIMGTDTGSGIVDQLVVNRYGHVTKPNQPFFSCKLNSQTSTSGGTVKLNTWVSLGSKGGLGSHFANSRFTAPIAGKYLFNYSGLHHSGAVSAGYSRAYTYVNGITVIDGLGDNDTEGDYQRLAYSVILNLAANDYVEIYINGGNSSAFVYDYYTTWSGYLLG